MMGNALVSAAVLLMGAAWLTHVVTCLLVGKYGFLIAGALFVPVGVINGIGIWFGAW